MFSILALAIFQLTSPQDAATPELNGIQEEIQQAEYRFSPVPNEDTVWSAPIRSQGLRSRIGAFGLEVFPRATDATGEGAAWKLTLRTVSFGRKGDGRGLENARIQAEGARLELDHGPLTEWFENRPEGVEQGWSITRPPIGVDPLWIGLDVQGDLSLRIDEGGRSGVFVDSSGEPRVRYRDLHVWDAEGCELEAFLAPSPTGPGIQIHDQGAVYPLTVDPVLTGPAWTAEGDQAGAIFGISVASAGDVNGDGFSDVIVGAFWYDNGQTDEGRAFLYLGSAAGLSASADWIAESDQGRAWFGCSVATAGDVNGDGYSDVIVGAQWYDNGQSDEGRAFLYLGSAAGLSTSAAWTAESSQVDAFFGSSVATAGDVNGDGYSDVIVGADSAGRAFLYLGSNAGLSTSAAWTADDHPGENFGHSVSTAGDVNGDGYSDVVIGSFVHSNLYLGSATGLSASAAWTAESDQSGSVFGYSVATAGDVNGDGYSDVIVGEYGYSNGQAYVGRAFLYLGSVAGLSTSAAWTAEGDRSSAQFGYAVATAGDVNGDGYSDVIVGAPGYDNDQTNEGRAFLYLGSAAGLSPSADWMVESDQDQAWVGQAVAMAGDVNGDGYSDVIVAAPSYSNDQAGEGRAFLYLGAGQSGCIVLDFETEDDFTTPLGNGQEIDTEFGRLVRISGAGANAGPTTFDTTPGGPNDPALNDDMLIGHGNVLLLEDDWYSFAETVPGFFDVVTDDPHGGDLVFEFLQPVDPRSMLLADINPPTNQGASVTLIDGNGRARVYAIEPGWTGGYGNAGPHQLDLTTTAPQPGNGTPRFATASEDPGFQQIDVVQMVVHLTGFGAVDELSLCLAPASTTMRNGSGSNPTILRSSSLPVLGSTWSAELDCSAYGSGLATLVMRRRASSGTMTPFGEVLVAGALLFSETRVFSTIGSAFNWNIPNDMALFGLDVHVQGACQAASAPARLKVQRAQRSLSNALDLVLGF